jgi:hypothetical protein
VLACIVQIEIHLAGIAVCELSEIDHHQASQTVMAKQQVDSIPFGADPESPLARDEGKIVAQFDQKAFQLS